MPLQFHIHTYGCQMNERDSEVAAGLLRRHGHQPAPDERSADLVIVNTCSVRAKAEDKALGKLGLLLAARRERPGLLVGVIGCMPQRMGRELLRRLPGLDFVLGAPYLGRLPEVLDTIERGAGPCLAVGTDIPDQTLQPHAPGKLSAFINILYGCNRRCSYCIVPRVRGPEHSRPASDIIAEAEALAAAGVREITLLGQSVMSYGRANPVWPDNRPSAGGFREPLPRLLEALDAIEGLVRLRFTSGHPSGCTPELARAMAQLPAVCAHLHLPLQSGADRILRLMRRGYLTDGYRQAVMRLRAAVPEMALTTDIIVGFPSETTAEFEQTSAFMRAMEFDNAFIFKYNPRPGTPAADMPDDVPDAEKMRRNRLLLDRQNRRSLAINRRLIGQRVEVLAEGPSRRNPQRWSGRTAGNKIVVFPHSRRVARGGLVRVTVAKATAQALYAEDEKR